MSGVVDGVLDGAVARWLGEVGLPGRRVVSVTVLAGGFSNENLLIGTDSGERFVLRRFLRGNSCAVEAALGRRLRGVVPVAGVVAAEPDENVAGQPLLLSEYVPGRLLSEVLAEASTAGGNDELAVGGCWRLGVVVGETLAAVGRVGFARPGFLGSGDGVRLAPEPGGVPEDLAGFVRSRMGETALLSRSEQDALVGLAEREQGLLDASGPGAALVHSDFNPKNLLVTQVSGQWRVAAVLDWEFAYSGHPLADVGNMLRFAEDYPAEYVSGFVAGLRSGGAALPRDWRETSAAMDLFALADLLTRPAGHPLADKVVRVVRQRLAAGLDYGHRNG